MRLRTALTVAGLFSTLAMAGCTTTSQTDPQKTAAITPAVAPKTETATLKSALVEPASSEKPITDTADILPNGYGPVTDNGFNLPAIPINRVKPQFRRQIVAYQTTENPGTIVVNTKERFLYYVLGDGKAIRYGIGVGKQGFAWAGEAHVAWKQEWPNWHPPKEMAVRKPEVAQYVEKGMGPGLSNPLGARAMYLFDNNNKDTLFRIHGTPEWASIGTAASSGCIRMMNQDVIDLYSRVLPGKETKVIVQQS
ncbi:L,D-transpeptidase [Allorhizobium sp. BGMRC 0089]|uniref:L,D-transpeptidase n=1 Tax=Allorhizobium sonneratiae TaxID=2934936 RepID=UPI0020341B93|nr:L,D-transpeptidase [Allorhizobium sonneratiae]MCM2294449.1 L,D-transpeptidase [Allorhizobium sonneratiae]